MPRRGLRPRRGGCKGVGWETLALRSVARASRRHTVPAGNPLRAIEGYPGLYVIERPVTKRKVGLAVKTKRRRGKPTLEPTKKADESLKRARQSFWRGTR